MQWPMVHYLQSYKVVQHGNTENVAVILSCLDLLVLLSMKVLETNIVFLKCAKTIFRRNFSHNSFTPKFLQLLEKDEQNR